MTRSPWFATAAAAAVALLLFVTGAVAAQESRFFSSQETGGAPGRYRVELELRPGDDLVALSSQLAATYGARIEPYAEEGFHGFAIMATPARARLMSSDPRVVAITDLNPPVNEAAPAEPVISTKADTPRVAVEQTRGIATEAVPGFGNYAYDPSGNITTIDDQTFRYDAFGRLQAANLGSFGTQAYTYDRYGNILKIVTNGDDANAARMSVDPETNQIDLPFSQSNPANMIATYDGVGNVITHNGTFVYDALNMMKETTDTNRRVFVYSAAEERVAVIKVANGVETTSEWTLRDGANRVLRRMSKDAGGVWHWKEDYVYGGRRLLAAEVAGSERVRHFHLDHLGTPRLITGNGGARVAEKTYRPFGGKVSPATDDFEQLEFTGHERDTPALDYMHARYYQTDLGRFLSVDPVLDVAASLPEPRRWNRYTYVANNPVNATDPTGAILMSLTGQGTILDIAGEAAKRVSFRADGTIDTSQLTADDLVNNEGALLLREMEKSDNVYTYEEGTTQATAGGTVTVDGVRNINDNPTDFRGQQPQQKRADRFPVAGVNGAITVDPGENWFDPTGTLSVPIHAVAFHELAEAYSRVEKNVFRGPDYGGPGGHYDAQEREAYLMMQRPAWTAYPAGGTLTRR